MNFKIIVTGLFMAMADSVPGVSGGTICYIMGLYDKLLSSVSTLTDKKNRSESLKFLSKLGTGWIIGFIFSILIVSKLLENNLYNLSSMFLGFIIISNFFTIKGDYNVLKSNLKFLPLTVVGIVMVVTVSYLGIKLNADSNEIINFGFANYIYYFIAGFVAVGTMLLPGISGSTMLLIFGVYFQVIDGIRKILMLDFSSFGLLFSLGLGILFGGFFAIKVLNYLFKNYKVQVLFLIQGLLIGSIYAIIVGPISEIGTALTFETFNVLWFILGVILIYLMEKLNK